MVFSLLGGSKMETPEIKISIELDGVGEDGVIFLRGERDRAASIFISGKLRVITNKSLYVRNLNIRLVGKVRMNVSIRDKEIEQEYETSFIRSETYFFQHCWNNVTTPGFNKKIESPKLEEESQSCFKSIFSTMKGYETITNAENDGLTSLAPGEHVFYFNTILPGDLPESIHNHPNVFIAYQLKATITQFRGLPDINTEKQLMIIRTVSIDMLDFQNSEYVQAKLRHIFAVYVELPWKIAAIGSIVDVCCLIRSKNVDFKISETSIELFEYGVYQQGDMTASKRRKVCGMVFTEPGFTSKKVTTDSKERIEWYKKFQFQIPDSLGRLTQDCSVLKKIKVSHLLEVGVTVSMPNGKIYHLDLQLPIYLYISTFIPLQIKRRNYFKETTLHYRLPPIEDGEPLETDCTILEDYNPKGNTIEVSNQDILMNDLFPSSYEDHVNDAKVELFNPKKLHEGCLVNDKTIVSCNATNAAQFENSYDIRYPPPCYENPIESLSDSEGTIILEPSIDLADMGEIYLDKVQNDRIISSILNIE